MLGVTTPANAAPLNQAFRGGLRERGWIEGKNVSIEYRYAEYRSDRLPELAADLVRLKVDVIVTGSAPAALAAQKATSGIPIVMAGGVPDPVAVGLIESLRRPGGNITGLSEMTLELTGKRLELLKDMVPGLAHVGVLWNPQSANAKRFWTEHQLPARQLRIELHSLEIRSPNDLDQAFEDATKARTGALLILPAVVLRPHYKRIAELAAKARLPSMHNRPEFADAGGLMSYGPDRADMARRAATYVDKILRGVKPSDLPVEQPTKFELVVNIKTAKALGIIVPQTILVRVDRLIE